jgi:hypothetical protein
MQNIVVTKIRVKSPIFDGWRIPQTDLGNSISVITKLRAIETHSTQIVLQVSQVSE